VATRLQAPVRAAVELRPVPSRTRNRRGAARRRAGGCSALASSSTVSARCSLLPRAARPGAEPRSRAGTRQPRGWGGRRRRRRLGAVGGSARRQRRSCSATSTTAASKPRAPPALGGARSRVFHRAAVKAMAQRVARGWHAEPGAGRSGTGTLSISSQHSSPLLSEATCRLLWRRILQRVACVKMNCELLAPRIVASLAAIWGFFLP